MKTTNNRQEKKLIYFDQAAYETVIRGLPKIIKYVIDLKDSYVKLEIGDFSNEIFNELITLGTENLQKRYSDGLNTSLNALGPINSQIRANLLLNTETSFKGLETAFNTLTRISAQFLIGMRFPLNAISIIDGSPVVTEIDLEKIKETYFRTYIETPIEHEIYDKMQTMAAAYNDMLTTFETVGYKQFFDMSLLEQLFSEDQLTKAIAVKYDAVENTFNFQPNHQMAMRNADLIAKKQFEMRNAELIAKKQFEMRNAELIAKTQ